MRKYNWISSIIIGFVALLSVLNAQTQTTNPLQVLKEETVYSRRNGRTIPFTTTYKQFEINSCTLSFTERTRNYHISLIYYQTYRYVFPLRSMNVKLEWLDTYSSFVVSLSGPGSIINIESSYAEGAAHNKYPAPNVSIPFLNEDHAKRAETALHNAIVACGGGEAPIQRMNSPARQSKEDLKPDANDDKFKVKVNVDLVTTDVTVAGDNPPELRAEDFIIYDNDIAQQISYFSHDQLPISVALVLQPQTLRVEEYFDQQIVALTSLRLLKPEDQVALYSLNGDRLSNFIEDRWYISKLLSFLAEHPENDLNIYGTLYDAARYLKQEGSGRHAIILISNNCHRIPGGVDADQSWGTQNALEISANNIADRSLIELLETATTLYNVVINDSDLNANYIGDPTSQAWSACPGTSRKIKSIAEDTGGEVIVLPGSVSYKNILEQAFNRLRTQYTIGFTPSNPAESGSFHQLTVRLAKKDRCPECRIKARRGYFAGISAPSSPTRNTQSQPSNFSPEIDNKIIQQSMVVAGSSYWDLDEISFELTSAEKLIDGSGQSQLKIDLLINPSGIDTATLEGRRAYSMQAAVFYSDKKGNLLGSNFWKIESSLSEEAYKSILTKGIPVSATIPQKIQDQILRIVIYDEKSGRIGSKFAKKNGKSFSLDPHPAHNPDRLKDGLWHPMQVAIQAGAPFSSKVKIPSESKLKSRVIYADQHFAEGSNPGSKTDRGQVYIGFGPPDDLRDLKGPQGPFQRWIYRDIPGVGKDIDFEFVDELGIAIYKIVPWSPEGNDKASIENRRKYNQIQQIIRQTLERVPAN